jgi:putative DNA primase/helicase
MTITIELLEKTIETLASEQSSMAPATPVDTLFGKPQRAMDETTRSIIGGRPALETSEELAKLQAALLIIDPDVGRGNGSIFNAAANTVEDYWLGVVWAVASLGWNSGKDIARKWSMQSERYDDDGFEKAWNGYDAAKNHAIGIGSLYKLAKLKGWSPYPVQPLPSMSQMPTNGQSTVVPMLDPTDAGNAIWLSKCIKGRVRWVKELNRWLCFDDYSGWVEKADVEMLQIAEQALRRLGQAGCIQFSGDELKTLTKHMIRSLNATPLHNALTLLKGQIGIIVSINDLDRNPMLLGVNNGLVVDLNTGGIRQQSPKDLITKRATVDYDQNAKCPIFEDFLLSIFEGNKDLIDYLQRWVGYVLTGKTTEQQMLFGYGFGANGKSVLFSVITELLGTYAVSAPIETFMLSANSDGPKSYLLARLANARLALANETSDGQRLAENLIKEMTGGERIASAHKYGHVFEYMPTFKLAIVGNHKPVIRGTDDGIWRRLQILPFKRKFEVTEQDPLLKQKLIGELSGILNWAITGCLAWQKEGRLTMPSVMKAEITQYRSESDIIGLWLEERCIDDPNEITTAESLYLSYDNWCRSNGHKSASQTTLGRRLSERGYQKKRGVKIQWVGIGLHQHILSFS